MPKLKITKGRIDKITLPTKGQVDYFDTDMKGFGIRASSTGLTYFVMRRIDGKKVRVTIGRHGSPYTPDSAREKAQKILGKMVEGTNPNEEKRAEKRKSETLIGVFKDYLDKRKLKENTKTLYRRLFDLYFEDWKKLPISEITKDMVTKRHLEIANAPRVRKLIKQAGENNDQKRKEASADGAMRVLRAIINFARDDNEDVIRVNPVTRLSNRKEWYKVARRRTVIKRTALPQWYDAVMQLENIIIRDFLLFLLMTGLRRNEAAKLKWKNVDFAEKSFLIVDPKNKVPFSLPISDFVYQLLKKRHQYHRENEYVFPSEGKAGYIQEPKRAIDGITEETGIPVMCHDLRRTFATIAESLDLSKYTLKALLNHKQEEGDVTAGYIDLTVERLREPVQRVSEALMFATKAWSKYNPKEAIAGKVITLAEKRRRRAV